MRYQNHRCLVLTADEICKVSLDIPEMFKLPQILQRCGKRKVNLAPEGTTNELQHRHAATSPTKEHVPEWHSSVTASHACHDDHCAKQLPEMANCVMKWKIRFLR